MYCPKCGTQVADGSKFCPACGNPVTPRPAAAPPAPEPAPAVPGEPAPTYAQPATPPTPSQGAPDFAPSKKGHGLRNAIIGIVAILVVALVAVSFAGPILFGPNFVSPLDFSEEAQVKRTVNGYFEEIRDFDLDEMLGGVDAVLGADSTAVIEQFVNRFSLYGFDFQGLYEAAFTHVGWIIDDVQVEGDVARVTLTVTFPSIGELSEQISATNDVSSLSTQEQMELIVDALRGPNVPTTTKEVNLDLQKVNGTWTINYLANLTSWLMDNVA